MDDITIRLKCLEIANGEHPGTRLMRAEELYKWVKSAPPAQGSESSGGPTASSAAPNAGALVTMSNEEATCDPGPVFAAGFKMTPDQLARLGVDPDELKRMSES